MDDALEVEGEETPAVYLPLVAIAPNFRGSRVAAPDGRRLSTVVLSTVLDDARFWSRDLVHAVVHRDNAPSRQMLVSAGLSDLGPIEEDYHRYAGVLPS